MEKALEKIEELELAKKELIYQMNRVPDMEDWTLPEIKNFKFVLKTAQNLRYSNNTKAINNCVMLLAKFHE